ncbi:hypothetical protein LPJ66_008550 [Kickxella alabastrina]|uniref:Uncharacterized protein n=1 Tax=Kickxella alabastrina TaxID=61397 RepID=A0ACC1IA16_9FUNG|nr:hypothetical protein LPJ66_008550 [Kickxella alabastrina]
MIRRTPQLLPALRGHHSCAYLTTIPNNINSSSSSVRESALWENLGSAPPITTLDAASISLIRRRLLNASLRPKPPHLHFTYSATTQVSSAAVLLALCTVNHQPHVLFQERNNKLSSHGGEVCFAGGKTDPSDLSFEETALRETREELGILPERVEILGVLPEVPNKGGTLKVHSVVGYLGNVDPRQLDINRREVHRAFALPLDTFWKEEERMPVVFRGRSVIPSYRSDKEGLVIWGLTAFILHEFLCRIADARND